MSVLVLHSDNYNDATRGNPLLRDIRFGAEDAAVREALRQGLYLAVGSLPGDSAERAVAATQNGRLTDSWSMEPDEGMRPLGAGFVEVQGERGGYRSSGEGDLFVTPDGAFVSRRGLLHPIAIEMPDASSIPLVGGGVLSDALAEA